MADSNEELARRFDAQSRDLARRLRENADKAARELVEQSEQFLRELVGFPREEPAPPAKQPAAG